MERAIYAIVVDYDSGDDGDAATRREADRARCVARPGYRRRLELRAGGWAVRADCYLYVTAEAATAALAALGGGEGRRASAALLLGEGNYPGVDDVTMLRDGRREQLALAAPIIPLW